MAPVPSPDEKGLVEMLAGRLRRGIARIFHRNRKPQFGSVVPQHQPVNTPVVDPNQLQIDFAPVQPPHATAASPVIAPVTGPATVQPVATPPAPTQPQTWAAPAAPSLPWYRSLLTNELPDLKQTIVVDGVTWGLALVVLLVIAVRAWGYNTLQSEMYGDIEIVQTYTRNVLAGQWPWYFTLSSGPLYHYLIAPVLYLLGDGYDQIKIASILVSFLILGFVYYFAKQFGGRGYAVLALAFAGTGSWLLIFSRLGNSQLFVPLVTMSTVFFLYRAIQTRRDGWLYASAIAATCGLYSYPQSYVVPPVMWLTVAALIATKVLPDWRVLVRYTGALLVGSLPFIWMYIDNPSSVTGNYISEKIAGGEDMLGNIPTILVQGVGAYFTSGDTGFRANPASLPHIDMVSSVLLLVGLVALFRRSRRALAPLFVIPLVLLHVPSLLVLRYPEQVPSASRSIGAAPFVYLIVALGLYELFQLIRRRSAAAALLVTTVLLAVSVQINVDRYFVKYVQGMPYGDVPIGRELVRFVESLSQDTTVYVAGCCWRDTSPEPFFVQLQLKQPERLQRFDPVENLTCEALAEIPRPAEIVWSFDEPLPSPNVAGCADEFRPQLHATRDGVPVFYSATLIGRADPSYQPPPTAEELAQQAAEAAALPPPPTEVPPPPTAVPVDSFSENLMVNGVSTVVTSAAIDMGSLPDLFDGNRDSLIRGANQNPMVLDLAFSAEVPVSSVSFSLAGMKNFVAILKVTTAAGVESYEQTYPVAESDQVVTYEFSEALQVQALHVTFFENEVPEDVQVNIHIRDITIQ